MAVEVEVEVAEVEVAEAEALVTEADHIVKDRLVAIGQNREAQRKVLQQSIGRKQPHLEQVLMLVTRYLARYDI